MLARDATGELCQASVKLPDSIKHKRYRQEFRTKFCEGLLSRRILIVEGATEATAMPVAARRLSELNPKTFSSFESLGLCTVDAASDSQIADLSKLYGDLGKQVYAVCDKQAPENENLIEAQVTKLFMHNEKGFEDLVLKNTTAGAIDRFVDALEWPPHLQTKYPDPKANPVNALSDYFGWSKGNWGIADFLSQCTEDEIPGWIRDTCKELRMLCQQSRGEEDQAEEADPDADEDIEDIV